MRLLFSFLFIFPILASAGGNWTSLSLDHTNALYSAGESAALFVRVNAVPTNPAYGVNVYVQEPGASSPTLITMEKGFGSFVSAPLNAGTQTFRVITRLTGPAIPPEPAFDEVVEDEMIHVQVNSAN